jgi:hypothetical protein
MIFKSKKKDMQIIFKKYFAILPITINQETRWLEFVTIKGFYWRGPSETTWWWESIAFVDKNK